MLEHVDYNEFYRTQFYNEFYRTQFYPTNFMSGLSGRQELKQLTTVLIDQGGLYQTAGEEMLDYYGLRQGKNLSVGPTLAEVPDAELGQ